MIRIRDLSIDYGGAPALQNINLHIPAGQCILITGPSGCGKSTLGYALAGLIPHAKSANMYGTVRVAGMETASHPLSSLAQHVGMVFQDPGSQLFHLRVDDEVAFGLRNLGLPESEVRTRVAWALSALGLEGLEDCTPAELSGGDQQRLAIATALAMRPQVLVLDEPTASLDVRGTAQIFTALQVLRERFGLTIILIEHRLAEAAQMADRILLIDEGKIIADGVPDAIFSNREQVRTLGLRRPTEEPPTPWADLLEPNGTPSENLQPLLQMHDLHAGYNGKAVLKDINLTLYAGEFVALVGNNGAGKSTLALVAAGLLKPSRGQFLFNGHRRPRNGLDIALLFQNPTDQLFTDSVDEEVAFCPRNYSLFDLEQHGRTLEETDLIGLRERRPNLLSMGQQQRIALAATISLRPQLVILDEPTLGQDWGHLERLMEFLLRLNQQGKTILLITHDYKLVYRYARRVILMEEGKIIMDGRVMRDGNQ